MSFFMDLTAAELADCLDHAADGPPNTGLLSQLHEATLAFRDRDPRMHAADRALDDARHAHMRSWDGTDYSPAAWERAAGAARALAAPLRPLGDMRIARCKRQAGWGTCNLPLDDGGQCRSTLGHADEQEAGQ